MSSVRDGGEPSATADPMAPAEPPAAPARPSVPARRTVSAPFADLPAPSALLFDLDGTLVDTVKFRVAAWRQAFEEIGIAADPHFLAGFIGSDGRWLSEEVARHYGRELEPAEVDGLDKRHGLIFDELNASPKPLPGASELLTALETSGLRFAIATSSQAPQVAVSLAALRLPAPPPVANGGSVARAKPEPDLLLFAAAQLGVAAAACWYVGDSRWDMMAAVKAGMTGIGVTSGACDEEGLLEAGATVAAPDLHTVLEALRARGLV